MRFLLACVVLSSLAACGGGGSTTSNSPTPTPSPSPTPGPYVPRPPPYPGPGGTPIAPPGSQFVIAPNEFPRIGDADLVETSTCLTPRASFGARNELDVAIDRVGYVLYGEDAGIGGYKGGDFSAILTPLQPFDVGATFDTDRRWTTPQPLLGVEHVGLARDVLGRWYAGRFVPKAGATGFVVTPAMLVSTP